MPEQPAPFNLDSLLTHREDCLATSAIPEISGAKLCGAQIQFDTEHKSLISYQADDLFDTEEFHSALTQLSSKRAHVKQITVDFSFVGVPDPCRVLFIAPGTVTFTDRGFGGRIFAWLMQSIFCRFAKTFACKLFLALALALAAASSSCPPLDGDDTPDDQEDPPSLSHQ